MTNDDRETEMAIHRQNMPYADGRPRQTPAAVEARLPNVEQALILEALAHLDDPDFSPSDYQFGQVETVSLVDQSGERQRLPVRPEGWTPGPGEEEITAWRIEKEPTRMSRYDRAFVKKRTLQSKYDAEADLHKKQLIGLQLAKAKKVLATELERGADETWRERDRIDEWRAGAGRDERNTSRRNVRIKPNLMTPKSILASETPEQREQRERATDKTRKKEARAALTEEQKAAVRLKDRERKALKAAEKKVCKMPASVHTDSC
jgi:hypothetical protein